MAETTGAASSTAEETDVFGGQQPTRAEYDSYRTTGEVPARFKPAATTAVDDAPEKTADEPAGDEPETESESETEEEVQEPPAKGSEAQKRILQLLAENKKLKESAAKPGVQQAPPAAQQAPQPPATRPKPVPEAQVDGKPKYATYEDYLEDLTDWKAEQHVERFKQQQQAEQQHMKLVAKIDEGKSIYGDDFGEVADNAAGLIAGDKDLPFLIKQRIARSELLPHLLYTMTGEDGGMAKFVTMAKSDPFRALDYIALTESGIREEFAKSESGADGSSGKAPEKKPTQAPKPPSPVSGTSSRSFDVSDESLSADEWARKRTQQLSKRKQG